MKYYVLLELTEAWNKPEKAEKWRAKSPAGASRILN
jgi:hypothetical protein